MSNKYILGIIESYVKDNYDKKSIINNIDIVNNSIGSIISGLSNYAAYVELPSVVAIWGIENGEIVGTDVIVDIPKDFVFSLSSDVVYELYNETIQGKRIVALYVVSAKNSTIQYKGIEYIFDNIDIKELSECPDIEQDLWRNLSNKSKFIDRTAMSNLSLEELFGLLDTELLFSMLAIEYPKNSIIIINKLKDFRFVNEKNTGRFEITNLGALLLAKRIKKFPSVNNKAIRVIVYDGNDVTCPAKEQLGGKGYIVGFEGLIDYIYNNIPTCEYIEGALRKQRGYISKLIIRELVANAMIHQDLEQPGAPTISIFWDHISITNTGSPIVNKDRFIDTPPATRNELLVSVMQKVGICESRGSGYDKIIEQTEEYRLPAPKIILHDNNTEVVLYYKMNFEALSNEEKALICYNHVCLNYINNKVSNNTSLRKRFNLDESQKYVVSRIFSNTCKQNLIKKKDNTAMKNSEYIPFWA